MRLAFLFLLTLDVPFAQETVVFSNVRVFDGTQMLERRSVVIDKGVIRSVSTGLSMPSRAHIIDGSGKTLLPGLIDAHTHSDTEDDLKQALAFGVTTEVDMFTFPEVISAYRALERAGRTRDVADVKFAGICITAPAGHGTEYGVPIPTISAPEQAQAFVDARISEGSDHIKVIYMPESTTFPSIDARTLAAVVNAAHRRGKLVIVHINAQAAAREAIRAGADGLAHIYYGGSSDPTFAQLARRRRAFIVPTLSVRQNTCGSNRGEEIANDPRFLPYLTPFAIRALKRGIAVASPPSCEASTQAVRQLDERGVPILAGTDANGSGLTHGASLHGEIALLVEAGLTPLKALAAATSAPAAAFRLTDRGRIAPGKRADLLLVDGNPGVDIHATRNIVGVWKQGRSFDRAGFRASLPGFKVPQSVSDSQFGTISDFDNGTLLTRLGTQWQTFDHVTMKLVTPGANGTRGALAMFGEVRPNRPAYMWPGIVFFPSGVPRRATDLSSKKGLIFWAKGDGRPYRVVLTTFGGPREKVFTPGPTWQPYSYPFTDFGGFNGFGIFSITFAASSQSGGFELQLDELAFK